MSVKICFEINIRENDNFMGTFHSAFGEEYSVTCITTIPYGTSHQFGTINNPHCMGGLQCSVSIKWGKRSNKLFDITRCEGDSLEIASSSKHLVKDKKFFSKLFHRCRGKTYFIFDITSLSSLIKCDTLEKDNDDQKLQTRSASSKMEPVHEKRIEDLSTDMKQLLQTGTFSDFVLSDGSNEIRAHRLVLCARSAVFAKMIQLPMKENRENRITIEDISFHVLKEMLNFMYTGTVTINDMKMARELTVYGR